MRSSDLTARIVLQRVTETADSFGEAVGTWSELAQVWASVEWRPGTESFQGDREYAETPVAVIVRRSTSTASLREKDRALAPVGATQVTTTIGTTTTALVVDTPGVFPPENEFCVRIDSELLLVASGAGTTAGPYVVSRGAYGTTAASHESGRSVIHMVPLDIVGVAPGPSSMSLTAVRGEVRTL